MPDAIGPYLRSDAASDYLLKVHSQEISSKTLTKLRCTGGGPAFRLAGRWPVYAPADLDAYAASRLSPLVRSTSELKQAAA